MPDPVRIGILGTGAVAARSLIGPAKDVPEVAITAVASRTPERAQSYAAEHGIPRAMGYDDLLADPEVDVVYITLPPSLHAEWSIKAMAAGKDVLCEKPLAANADEAELIDEAARRTGRIFIEAYHYHHHPLAHRLRELVNANAIGRLEELTATFHIPKQAHAAPGNIRHRFDLAGGATMDAACYCVHAFRHLVGEPVTVRNATATISADDQQIDLGMRAELEFADGVVGTVDASFLAENGPDVVLTAIGSRGRLEVTSLYVPQWGGALRGEWDGRPFDEAVDPTPTYVYQLREVARCIRDGLPVLTTAADGIATMQVVDDIYRAAGLLPRPGTLATLHA